MKVNKYLIFILGALGGLLYGYDNGIISGALLYIPKDIPLHNGQNISCLFFLDKENIF